jgi:hypothetical protein
MAKSFFFKEGEKLKTTDCGEVVVGAGEEKKRGLEKLGTQQGLVPVWLRPKLFGWVPVAQVREIERYRVSPEPLTINGVKEVSVEDVVALCGQCDHADGGDLAYMNTRKKILGCSFLQIHWCHHPTEYVRQAENTKSGLCLSTGRKSVL